MKIKRYIEDNNLGIVLNNKKFKDITTMKVGGKIKNLYYPNSIDNLTKVLNLLEFKKKKYLLIGNGSNIIAADRTCYHWVISGKHLEEKLEINEDEVIVSAFMDLRKVIAKLVANQINTLTLLAGIPATVGGAIYMNAGANGYTISDDLLWVKYLESGFIRQKNRNELKFSYRKSPFKNKKIIILEAAFKKKTCVDSLLLYEEVKDKRMEKQPLTYPNSGSIFKNGNNFKAYEIIRKINLVGYRIGKATFSSLHANFIINLGKAKAKDIYTLIKLAKKLALVYENIHLEEEVILYNFRHFDF